MPCRRNSFLRVAFDAQDSVSNIFAETIAGLFKVEAIRRPWSKVRRRRGAFAVREGADVRDNRRRSKPIGINLRPKSKRIIPRSSGAAPLRRDPGPGRPANQSGASCCFHDLTAHQNLC